MGNSNKNQQTLAQAFPVKPGYGIMGPCCYLNTNTLPYTTPAP